MTRSTARSPGSNADKNPTKRAAPKKAATKNAATKKAAPKKAATKEAAPKKAAPRKAAARTDARPPSKQAASDQQTGDGRSRGGGASQIAEAAAVQLLELTGKQSEGIVGLERTDDGWRVQVEVVELRRIPSTTDVLATYEVTVDEGGQLIGYRRLGRFVRGSTGEEGR